MAEDALPPGKYFVVMEPWEYTDSFSFTLWTTPVCEGTTVWDETSGSCIPWDCQVTDLGEYSGEPLLVTGDTCRGTELFTDPDGDCVENAGGLGQMYSLRVPAGKTFTAVLAPTDQNKQQPSLYLLNSCEDFQLNSCLASDSVWNGNPMITYTNSTDSDETVYLGVDEYAEMLYFYSHQNRIQNCWEYLLVIR